MEFDKKCRVSLSPNTVLPPCPEVEKRTSKVKPRRRDELLIIEDDDFTEIRFSRFRSASCKNESSRQLELDGGVELRRGSVYQTSREVRSVKRLGTEDVRSKIEISRSSDKYLSVKKADAPCSSSNASPLINLNDEPCSSDDFVSNKSVMSTVAQLSKQGEPLGDPNCRPEHAADGKCSVEKDRSRLLHKSVSARVGMQQSPCQSCGDSPRASPRSRFSLTRKIMDPFMKSKSQRSPLGYGVGFAQVRRAEIADASDGITRESSPDKERILEVDSHCCPMARACLPTHLHGCLKLKSVNGVPVFEFSMKCPEDVFVAKTWRTKNADSWVYTFHTNVNRKKSCASARGSKVCDNVDASIVGQMQVSSYLHSEHGGDGDTLTTEFVLYDIAHASRCLPAQETPLSLPDTFRLSKGLVGSLAGGELDSDSLGHEKLTPMFKHGSDLSLCDSTSSYPWARAHLHPNLEVAAIVVQVPFEKRESLKNRTGEKIREKGCDGVKRGNQKINVVASTGSHSLPDAECRGPSTLLSRWRSGGGCECGGWDMACPLTVFNNEIATQKGSHRRLNSELPTELFIEGVKEDTPAFSVAEISAGHYSVDFHARLSALQAFAICVATFHGSEPPTATRSPVNIIPTLPPATLKTFLLEPFIESVADPDKKQTPAPPKAPPSTKEASPFTFNPPFSPISRA
uniref:Uncharacterized protein n=1 Tax=Kalanchoe fedtschenkoi TaxID=63787 RepID=A0A7N0U142_KALFE